METTVKQIVDFSSNQTFDVSPTTDIQNAQQLTTVNSQTTTRDRGLVRLSEKHLSYPLTIGYSFVVNPDGSFYQTTTSDQKDLAHEIGIAPGLGNFEGKLANEVHTTDTLNWDSSGNFLGPTGAHTWQTFTRRDSLGQCYSRTLTASAQKLTSVKDGVGCQ